MKVRNALVGAALVIVTATITTQVVSQDRPKDRGFGQQPQLTPEQQKKHQEMEAKWKAFKTPGENHRLLNFKVGRWNGNVKMWMEPDQVEPTQSNCTSEYKWILENRYLSENVEGQFMDETFLGQAWSGFDNVNKKFQWVWIDNMGTGFMTGLGTYDAATKTFKYNTEGPCPIAGKNIKGWATERVIDNDHFVTEMHGPDPKGKEFKMMEITYTRAR